MGVAAGMGAWAPGIGQAGEQLAFWWGQLSNHELALAAGRLAASRQLLPH